jgi:hypothetical protein
MLRRTLYLALALVLGLVLLAKGLQWFSASLRERARGPRRPIPVASVAPQGKPPASPTPTPLPEPTQDEVQALAARDLATRRTAAETLLKRGDSAAVQTAVASALANPANAPLRDELLCLQARADGPESIAIALRALPTDPRGFEYNWDVPKRQRCYVAALARQAEADPERIADALVPAVLSWSREVHETAVAGLVRCRLSRLPGRLEVLLKAPEDENRRFAWRAALAIGIVDMAPERVERAMDDPVLQQSVRRHLVESPRVGAARVLALLAARDSGSDAALREGLQLRESRLHDASAALVEIATSETHAPHERRRALELLAVLSEPGALVALEALRPTATPELATYWDACIEALNRNAKGRPVRMKALGT